MKRKGLYRIKINLDEMIYLDGEYKDDEILSLLFDEMNQSCCATKPDVVKRVTGKKDFSRGWGINDIPYNSPTIYGDCEYLLENIS